MQTEGPRKWVFLEERGYVFWPPCCVFVHAVDLCVCLQCWLIKTGHDGPEWGVPDMINCDCQGPQLGVSPCQDTDKGLHRPSVTSDGFFCALGSRIKAPMGDINIFNEQAAPCAGTASQIAFIWTTIENGREALTELCKSHRHVKQKKSALKNSFSRHAYLIQTVISLFRLMVTANSK